MKDLLGDKSVPGLVPHDLEAQLHLACDDGEPRFFAEAEGHAAWRAAMQSEMDAVEKNHTWELADLPRGHRVITLKWVFKLKRLAISRRGLRSPARRARCYACARPSMACGRP